MRVSLFTIFTRDHVEFISNFISSIIIYTIILQSLSFHRHYYKCIHYISLEPQDNTPRKPLKNNHEYHTKNIQTQSCHQLHLLHSPQLKRSCQQSAQLTFHNKNRLKNCCGRKHDTSTFGVFSYFPGMCNIYMNAIS